jgi:hypothetical protein
MSGTTGLPFSFTVRAPLLVHGVFNSTRDIQAS